MKLIVVLLAGVLTYAVVLLVLGEAMAVADESPWYWLPFVASLAAVVAVSAPWRSWHSVNRKTTIAAVCLLAVLVLAIDLASAVWYSCSKGICL